MNSFKKSLITPLPAVVLATFLAGGTGAAMAADNVPPALDGACVPHLDPVEARLYGRYKAGGMERLYHYMYINRTMLQRSIYETGVWAEDIEARRIACLG
jgi:hypothetical protein